MRSGSTAGPATIAPGLPVPSLPVSYSTGAGETGSCEGGVMSMSHTHWRPRARAPFSGMILSTALVLCVAAGSNAMDQASAEALAPHLLTRLGRTHGVASVPRCGNGNLAIAIAQAGGMLVHAMDNDAADVASTRSCAVSLGLLGSSFAVEAGAVTPLPYASDFVDLLVVADLSDAELSTVSFDDIRRALCPGGKAYVGRASAEGAGLSTAALQAWCNGKPEVTVTTDAQGTWAVLTKTEDAGADEWSHRMHGPDNNPFSLDTEFDWPSLPQFRVKPYNVSRYGTLVAAGGRLFVGHNEAEYWSRIYYKDPVNGEGGTRMERYLRAYRVYNGQPLWVRNLEDNWPDATGAQTHETFPVGGSFMVAADDSLYVMTRDYVMILDPETGDSTGIVRFGNVSQTLKWIALDGSRLFTLAGDSAYESLYGSTIASVDLATGAQWRHVEPGRIHHREIGVSGGKLFYYAQNSRVACLDAQNGTLLWQNADPTLIGLLDNHGDWASWPAGELSGFICSPRGVFICNDKDNYLCGLNPSTGALDWSYERLNGRIQAKVLIDSILYAKSVTTKWGAKKINVETQTISDAGIGLGGGCGTMSATPRVVYGQAGGVCHLFGDGRSVDSRGLKGDCDIPSLFAHGTAITTPAACGCNTLSRGAIGDRAAGSFTFDRAAVQSERLETGPAHGALDIQLTPAATDWPTHRGNISRSAAADVAVSLAPNHHWTHTPAHPYVNNEDPPVWHSHNPYPEQEPTPPVVVGNLVFWGGSDGFIRCYDMEAMGERWVCPTGGRIYATPTIYDGCVYAGSGDGYAYCVEAHSGRLVWRFRGAPFERRFNLYGHLVSTWPVLTGVLVHNDVAYFAAGLLGDYGSHVYGLDAKSGAIVWQNNASGTYLDNADRLGFSPGGYMTIVNDKLWIRAFTGRDGIFDLATGAFEPIPTELANKKIPNLRGRDIGLIDGTHLVQGGRFVLSDHGERGAYVRSVTHHFVALDDQGAAQYPEVELSERSALTPAWDSRSMYLAVFGNEMLERWDLSRMKSHVDSIRAANGDLSVYPDWKSLHVGADYANPPPSTPMSRWRRDDLDLNAVAVAANAIVVTHGDSPGNRTPFEEWAWHVAVLDTGDGHTLWEQPLPSQPLHQGLALDRDGNILVMLLDGSLVRYGAGAVSVAGPRSLVPEHRTGGGEQPISLSTHGWTDAATPPKSATAPAHAEPASLDPPDRRNDALAVTAPGVGQAAVIIAAPAIAVPQTQRTEPAQAVLSSDAACRAEGQEASVYTQHDRPRYEPRDMHWTPSRTALKVVAVTAGGHDTPNEPSHATDRDLRSRWSSTADSTQWLTCDLGRPHTVSAVTLVWYAPAETATDLSVELSVDGTRYEQVDAALLHGSGTQTTLRSFLPDEARFVRIVLSARSTAKLPSVFELAVHGGHTASASRSPR